MVPKSNHTKQNSQMRIYDAKKWYHQCAHDQGKPRLCISSIRRLRQSLQIAQAYGDILDDIANANSIQQQN